MVVDPEYASIFRLRFRPCGSDYRPALGSRTVVGFVNRRRSN